MALGDRVAWAKGLERTAIPSEEMTCTSPMSRDEAAVERLVVMAMVSPLESPTAKPSIPFAKVHASVRPSESKCGDSSS